jgi:sugar phosphate isomerase/epimerase
MPKFFLRFDRWGGNEAIMAMQVRYAVEHSLGLELNVHSFGDLESLRRILKETADDLPLGVHIRRGKELDLYFSDDRPEQNAHHVVAAAAFFLRSPGIAHIVHDETDPHARTLSDSRMRASLAAYKQLEPLLADLGKMLYIEFSCSLSVSSYRHLMERIRDAGLLRVGSCIDTGHVYYHFRRQEGQSRDGAVDSLRTFIQDIRSMGVAVYYHVHDCDPNRPHPWYHVADHKPIGDGEIGVEGFRSIAGLLKGSSVTLELLPLVDYDRTTLAEAELRMLIGYAGKHRIDEAREVRDGKIMKRTLEAMLESKGILEDLIRSPG